MFPKIYFSDSKVFRTGILLYTTKKIWFCRTAVGNLKFYKSCLCQERRGFHLHFIRWTFHSTFPSCGTVSFIQKALVWRCSWNACGTYIYRCSFRSSTEPRKKPWLVGLHRGLYYWVLALTWHRTKSRGILRARRVSSCF